MKLKFKTQNFQTDAVDAVADLFAGQGIGAAPFSISFEPQLNIVQNELGIGNALNISGGDLLQNMNRVQKRNKLTKSKDLYPFAHIKQGDRQFCIEMETGTGKTYVYTKTIFELNKRYGLTKFIIVVPSVPIREGVYKSLQITAEHFAAHYDNVPCRYFIYNSAKLSDVRQFSTSNNIEIMIINIDSFKKAQNVINQQQDKLNGETAMRYIQETNPIVIIDEPQSVDNTELSKLAIEGLNPLFVLRYSATHKEKRNMLYKLNPVDAYEMGLVKQIVVVTNTVESDYNKPYIALKSVNQDGGFRAKVEIDVQGIGGKVTRKTITIKPGDDLYALSGKRDLYSGYKLSGIDCAAGREYIEFSNTEILQLGKNIGGIDDDALKRAQILRTIESHLDKELGYTENGIKVLSLFFIDEVAKYRTAEGEKGVYAEIFESCYEELLNRPKYASLKDRFPANVDAVHNGYFSQDKKGVFKNTRGDTLADDDTYNTIMRDKEWLLSFECPLRFIFSHSALKEGWDNPNVFQVCTLIEQKSLFTRRQKIGRGLRLCVDQDGNRIEDRDINILHVMANESFAEFAESLQKEIEAETGIKFGIIQIESLIGLSYEEEIVTTKTVTEKQAESVVETLIEAGVIDEDGKPTVEPNVAASKLQGMSESLKSLVVSKLTQTMPVSASTYSGATYTDMTVQEVELTYDDAEEIIQELKEKKYIKQDGTMTSAMKKDLEAGKLELKTAPSAAKCQAIIRAAQQANRKLVVRDGNNEVTVKPKKQAFLSPEFTEIWNRVKQKTSYRIQIDTEKLVESAIKELKAMPPLPKATLVTETADLQLQDAGVSHNLRGVRTMELETNYSTLPDIVRLVATETLLKRSTVIKILTGSDRMEDFANNPQAFTEKALEIIARNRHNLAIDGISYIKLDGQEYWVAEAFGFKEKPNGEPDFARAKLQANLARNAVAVESGLFDHVIYDSGVESRFAQSLDRDPDVKLFFKIPSRFTIDTPIGTYNPDWAVYLEKDGDKKLYFILETKGTTDIHGITPSEKQKIRCGKAHFDALESEVLYVGEPVRDWHEFRKKLT